ncbi:MAG TPA: L-lactate permease [Rubrobacteraceae bacterium]|nr:L-lactate permease [Rubrobacteraceae bacterium]
MVGYVVAGAPFLVAGITLLGLRWPAVWAGLATLIVAVGGALLWPALDPDGLAVALVDGLGTSGRVLYILFGGLLLYNLLSAGGAVAEVSQFLGRLEPERGALALGVVVGAAPFFESVTGFGVAVVISAPILLAAGFSPLKAAVLASWGQCAVPWGALGVGTVIGADLAGMGFGELSDLSAFLSLPLFPIYGLSAAALAGGRSGVKEHGLEATLLGLVAGVGTVATSLYVVPELSGALGGLAATTAFLLRRRRRLAGLRVPVRSLAPYAFLLALLAAANVSAAAAALLEELGPLFVGPGLPLLISCVFAARLMRLEGREVGTAASGTLRQWFPTAGAVLTFVLAGQVVASSGAAALLAAGAAAMGGLYPVLVPVVGALGGALTGSNAASNALFMPLQVEAARNLGISEAFTAAGQNVSGSHASLLAPQRVILAATATGLLGREGDIVRAALPPVLASVVVLGVAGLVVS